MFVLLRSKFCLYSYDNTDKSLCLFDTDELSTEMVSPADVVDEINFLGRSRFFNATVAGDMLCVRNCKCCNFSSHGWVFNDRLDSLRYRGSEVSCTVSDYVIFRVAGSSYRVAMSLCDYDVLFSDTMLFEYIEYISDCGIFIIHFMKQFVEDIQIVVDMDCTPLGMFCQSKGRYQAFICDERLACLSAKKTLLTGSEFWGSLVMV